MVRVQWNDPAIIKRVLDMGAYGIMVPWIGGRAEAEAAVRAAKYPPDGIRGSPAATGPGATGDTPPEYWKRANEEVLVVLQVETRAAVEEIDQIVKIPGVDVIFIGPGDLSTALGHMGNPGHPDVQAAFARRGGGHTRGGPRPRQHHAWLGAGALSSTERGTSSSRSPRTRRWWFREARTS